VPPTLLHRQYVTNLFKSVNQQTTEKLENVNQPPAATFRTPAMHVYIEYTDAFGVVYNGNYLKFFDRALQRTDHQRPDWLIVRVGQQKFKQSPALGGTFVIEGVRKEVHEAYEVWDMDMKSVDNLIVFNSVADVRIAQPAKEDTVSALPVDPPFDIPEGGVLATDTFYAYRDEFEPHLQGTIPLRNVLNLFERSRSNYLGGPDVLREMQTKEGIIFVVTNIEDACLIDDGATCCAGDELIVETTFVAKRKGMVLDCLQTLKRGTARLAQAKVRVMVLNATTMRPTNQLPESLRTTLSL
jgi:acyl-CoA thioesterase FadM